VVYELSETSARHCAPAAYAARPVDTVLTRCALLRSVMACLRPVSIAGLTCFALLLAAPALRAAKPENAASNSRSTRDEAVRGIPLDQLNETAQQKIASVLKQVSIFRRLPTQVIECDPNLYLFLIEHPEMVVNMWEVMDVSDMKLEKSGADQFKVNDGVGTVGKVEFLYHSPDQHIMFAEGAYNGPMFVNAVKGKCLLVLKTGYVRETNGKYFVTCRLDTFIQLENVGLEFVARTFQPMIGKTADHNFRETAAFLAMISRSAEVQHPSLQQLTERLTRVSDEDRDQFAAITDRVGQTAQQLAEQQLGQPSSQPSGQETPPLPIAQTSARQPQGTLATRSKPLAMAPARPQPQQAQKSPPPSAGANTPSSSWPKAPIPTGTRKTVMKPSTAR